MFVVSVLQVVVVIANVLNGANLYGYIKCRVGGGKSLREYATGMVSRQMFSTVSKPSRLYRFDPQRHSYHHLVTGFVVPHSLQSATAAE